METDQQWLRAIVVAWRLADGQIWQQGLKKGATAAFARAHDNPPIHKIIWTQNKILFTIDDSLPIVDAVGVDNSHFLIPKSKLQVVDIPTERDGSVATYFLSNISDARPINCVSIQKATAARYMSDELFAMKIPGRESTLFDAISGIERARIAAVYYNV